MNRHSDINVSPKVLKATLSSKSPASAKKFVTYDKVRETC